MAIILVFGDSIGYGRWDAKGGWAEHLRSLYMQKNMVNIDPYFEVYNLSVDGSNSVDLLERLEFEIRQRTKDKEETKIIVAVGINDSQIGSVGISIEKFEKNINLLIKIASKHSSKIVFIGLSPVDELKTNPIPWDKKMFYKNKRIKKYDNIIKSICQKNNIYFIDILDELWRLDYKKMLEDGLHPNSEGHKKIFEIVRDFLIEKGIVEKNN